MGQNPLHARSTHTSRILQILACGSIGFFLASCSPTVYFQTRTERSGVNLYPLARAGQTPRPDGMGDLPHPDRGIFRTAGN